jgi:hypothetical protein
MKRDREWFAEKMPVMKDLWDKVIHGREHGLSEFREDNSTYSKEDAQVSTLHEAVVADVPVQGVPEPAPVCGLYPTRETFMSEFDTGKRSKLGTA